MMLQVPGCTGCLVSRGCAAAAPSGPKDPRVSMHQKQVPLQARHWMRCSLAGIGGALGGRWARWEMAEKTLRGGGGVSEAQQGRELPCEGASPPQGPPTPAKGTQTLAG